jgi:zinc protease
VVAANHHIRTTAFGMGVWPFFQVQVFVNFRLPNGLEVVLEENHAAPVVAFQAWVKVGSADEPPELAGISHLCEHMVFKGTGRRGVGQIAQEVERAGGEINAWTSYDETAYHLVLANTYFDTGLDILADTLQNSAFDPEELERERKVVIEEIKQGRDDPDRTAAQGLFETAFDAHPYGRPIIGSSDSVGRLTRDDLVGFFRRHYVASNVTLVVVGDIDAAAARQAIESTFGAMTAGSGEAPRAPQPPQEQSRVRVLARAVKECQVLLGFRVPGVDHPDIPALDLLAVVLGQGESSRLHLEVVRNRQLATSASSYTFAARDPGLFVVGGSLPPGKVPAAAEALVQQTLRLAREEISAEELARSRTILESERVFDKETVQGYARKLGFLAAIAGDLQFEDRYFQRLARLGPADLREVAARYLRIPALSLYTQIPGGGPEATNGHSARDQARVATTQRRLEAVLARAAGSPARRRRTTPVSLAPDVTRHRLRSGARVLILRDPSVPVVALRGTWVGGLRYEDERSSGISNLLAAMLTRGTRTRDAEGLMRAVEGMAGALSGYAGRNSLGLQAEFLSKHLELGLDLVADCLQNATFPEAEIDHERRLILDDIHAQEDNLTHVAFRAFHGALWTKHPYRLDPLGTADSLTAMSRRRLQSFFRQHYPPSALTLAIVGDVEPQAVIRQLSSAIRPEGPARAQPPARSFEPPVLAPREAVRFLAREQAHLVVGFPGASLSNPDRFSLELLAQVLSGQGGRLFVEIREKRALAYRVSAFSLEGLDPGYFAVYVSTSPEQVQEVLHQIRLELRKLREEGIGADELERAQRYLIGTHAIGLQRKSAIAAALVFNEAYGQGWRAYRQYAEQIRAVGLAQIRRAAQNYLQPQREVVAVVRPRAEGVDGVRPAAKRSPKPVAGRHKPAQRP